MKTFLKRFSDDTKGAVALIVVITLVLVMLGVLSLAIDMNRTQTSYSKNQGTTDAAALGTSEFILRGILDQIGKDPDPFSWSPGQDKLEEYADRLITQNFANVQTSAIYDPSSLVVRYETRPSANGTGSDYIVYVKACADLKTEMADAANHAQNTRTCTSSNAAFSLSTDTKVEVAFALDYTSSMYCGAGFECITEPSLARAYDITKAKNLVDTMNFIFNTYFADTSATNKNIYASIVPFSGLVNLFPYNSSFIRAGSGALGVDEYRYETLNFRDFGTSTDLTSTGKISPVRPYYVNYGPNFRHVLDRIPSITSAAQLSALSAPNSNPMSLMPLDSFRATYDSINQSHMSTASTEIYKYNLCYNGAVLAALDQRIERQLWEESRQNAGGSILTTGAVSPPRQDERHIRYRGESGGMETSSLKELNADGQTYIELHESFPVQPLTNEKDILSAAVSRFTAMGAGASLFGDNYEESLRVINHQTSRINKSAHFTHAHGTSSINGLLWAWLTIENHTKGSRWSAPSVTEKYVGGLLGGNSAASRRELPSDKNRKYLILITDGMDNDGKLTGSYRIQCDGYAPNPAVTDDQYVQLCGRIKQDDVKIYTILYDFYPTGSIRRYEDCSSTDGYYPNVTPDKLQEVMDGIFKEIISSLITVRLV